MHALEPALTPFNIETFGGAPPDDGEAYTADDVFTGYALAVSHLIEEVVTRRDVHHSVATTAAALFALSSPERGIAGARWVARMQDAYCAGR